MHTIIRDNYDPTPNEYHETIVVDEAREKRWLFDCDGVFQDITNAKVVSERGESEDYAASQKWVTEELEALEDADQALQDNLDAEETARIAADETLQDNIDAEEADRTAADIEIWDEIETLEAASDVVDVVGTKAELDEYDTSTLTDEDIIKVLQDETKEDATTYYRWDKTNSTFVYVGEEGPYYTQTQVDTLLDGKQDKLIAGANIQIAADGKTISATDTTYSDFAGTDGTAAGAAGLVPAPATTDAGKYLKADGTWTAISIPTVTLYSGTGQNTDGAMTQKAVTDTLFENNDTTRIKIGSGAVNSGAASIVIGSQGAQVLTPNSVAIGNGGTTAGSSGGAGYNVAIGSYGVVATGGQSVAIGGYGATATAEGTIAIGTNGAQASGVGSIAIGRFVRASHKDSVALGTDAITGRASEVSIGQDAAWPNPEVTKYIAHVTAGVNDTDAVNVAQLNAAIPGAMTGATSSAAGTSGLVPAPAAGSQDKFLKGDGTWTSVSNFPFFTTPYRPDRATAVGDEFSVYDQDGNLVSWNDFDDATYATGAILGLNGGLDLVFVCPLMDDYHGGEWGDVGFFTFNGVEYTLAPADGAGKTASIADFRAFQLELTAGQNIQISRSGYSPATTTISATDTTYSVFAGATSSVAGSAGLVPAPTTSDPDKYLKGDGTWANLPTIPVTNNINSTDWNALWQ